MYTMGNIDNTGKAGTTIGTVDTAAITTNNTGKGHKLPERLMLRVKACAILFLDSPRAGKINQIAQDKGITVDDAAVMYTLGALKAAKRRGTARNYADALDALEAEQVGDRGSRITRTVSAANTAREAARINRINTGTTRPMGRVLRTLYREADTTRSMGKVLGTLYTEWESREADLDPALIAHNKAMQAEQAQVEKNLRLFFAEYADRLSKTSKARLYELAGYTGNPGYLFGPGMKDPETKRLAWGAYRLYEAFPYHDDICGKEFIELVRKYLS